MNVLILFSILLIFCVHVCQSSPIYSFKSDNNENDISIEKSEIKGVDNLLIKDLKQINAMENIFDSGIWDKKASIKRGKRDVQCVQRCGYSRSWRKHGCNLVCNNGVDVFFDENVIP